MPYLCTGYLPGASLRLCTTQLPALPGPRKSPNCLSPTPDAGWRCGSSYPGGRRQGGGGAAAEKGPGAGSAAVRPAGLPSLASFSFFVLSSRLGRFPPSSAPRPSVACSPSASGGLGFPTTLSSQRQAEAGAWAGRRRLGGRGGLEAPEGRASRNHAMKCSSALQSLNHSLGVGRPV